MKANVLIYKWVTLGKPWRCGAFSFRASPGSWLELTLAEACDAEEAPEDEPGGLRRRPNARWFGRSRARPSESPLQAVVTG